jgi:hypothetical protein
VSKQRRHRVHTERLDLKKLKGVDCKEQHCVELPNRFTALENLGDEVDTIIIWETVRPNIKIPAIESLSYYELKKINNASTNDSQN